ncbi:peptidoglycan/LPS O-acetylase OafA/YrhL [Sphingomonas leidyi]|uniref:Peptidoglycan/LPS O-acetylase OafA/YrhL n=1 Tax=Sphingomonas leidyi TaxID=68569 RepID=A0A7X5ZUF0_9SPHN|nr:acyltransferase [Sphingomonas leidyi]NIJ63629.1 peptidoglycan/LPS O-acetylase OafA/YrhL [Sphingomonas leidyi]
MPRLAVHSNNFNLIRLCAAAQVLIVHGLNHHEITGWGADVFKAIPGVPVFFFISGFLISASYLRTRERGLGEFFRNRILRIYPALIVCVLFATAMVAATGYLATQSISPARFVGWVLGQMSFLQFYNPDFMRGFGVGVLNGALWTITVELQFYLLTPPLMWLISRKPRIAAALFAISLAANLYLGWVGGGRSLFDKLLAVSFVPWVYMFMIGMLVALRPGLARKLIKPTWLWALPIAYLASIFALGGYEHNAQNSINPVSFLILAVLIFKLAYLPIPFARRAQTFIGRNDFSYGIYLYHMPLINLTLFLGMAPVTGILTAAGCAILCALLSWYLVERPALKRKH